MKILNNYSLYQMSAKKSRKSLLLSNTFRRTILLRHFTWVWSKSTCRLRSRIVSSGASSSQKPKVSSVSSASNPKESSGVSA